MNDASPPGDEAVRCPRCGVVNYPNALICVGCGIRLDTYAVLRNNYDRRQAAVRQALHDNLAKSAGQSIRAEIRLGWWRLAKLLLLVLLLSALLAAALWAIGAWNAYTRQLQQERLDAIYLHARQCEIQLDLVCARDDYLQIYKQAPDFRDSSERLMEIHMLLADQYRSLGQLPLAVDELQQALALAPDNPAALNRMFELHVELAGRYASSGMAAEALDEYNKALAMRPGNPDVLADIFDLHFHLAQQYADAGQTRNALDEVNKALQIRPADAAALALRTRLTTPPTPTPAPPPWWKELF